MRSLLYSILAASLMSVYTSPIVCNDLYSSETYNFTLTYAGLTVARVNLTEEIFANKGSISVSAVSTRSGRLLFPIDNHYTIEYMDEYLPVVYNKQVSQRGFSLNKKAFFDRQNNTVIIKNSDQIQIELDADGRDFFSSLFFLGKIISGSSKSLIEQGTITVYANGNYWQADFIYSGEDTLRGDKTRKYKVVLEQITDTAYSRSDVLTNNLIKKDTELFLWFSASDSVLPVRAEFTGSPFSTFWHLDTD